MIKKWHENKNHKLNESKRREKEKNNDKRLISERSTVSYAGSNNVLFNFCSFPHRSFVTPYFARIHHYYVCCSCCCYRHQHHLKLYSK